MSDTDMPDADDQPRIPSHLEGKGRATDANTNPSESMPPPPPLPVPQTYWYIKIPKLHKGYYRERYGFTDSPDIKAQCQDWGWVIQDGGAAGVGIIKFTQWYHDNVDKIEHNKVVEKYGAWEMSGNSCSKNLKDAMKWAQKQYY